MFKVIQGNLSSHSNTLTLTDITIGNNSIFEVYTNNNDIIPTSVSVSEHTVTIIFDGVSNTSTEVKVLINNIEGEYVPQINATDVSYSTSNVKEVLDGTLSDIDLLTTEIDERVPGDTILGGVLYHSTSGNVWKKLTANNLDYDDNSTIYSAIGDIDELETTSTNLVDAINEVKESGGGGIGYIDTSRVIYRSGNDPVSNLSPYTATENCWAMTYCCSTSSGAYAQIYLNGVIVLGTSGSQYVIQTIPLKQGDTVTFRTGNSFKYILVIYGMKG